ncbi:MAG: glutamate racemase [Thermodesulfobacteriota bacterium]
MIGIFDSGVGGMTVARAIRQLMPGYPFLYFGDLARTPYGSKSPETILDYSRQNTAFLLEKGARVVVVACNTASSVAPEVLRREFPVPIFEVISPVIATVAREGRFRRIGVIGTRATVQSGVYERGLKEAVPGLEVDAEPCPLLVPLVEEGWTSRQETKMILRRYLAPLKARQVEALILGCTHYPLLKHLIQIRIGRRVRIIDSSEEVAVALARFLDQDPGLAAALAGQAPDRFFVSDWTPAAAATAQAIFGRPVHLEKV